MPQFGFQGNAEGLARKGGWGALIIGALFALAFCPTSGVFYFGMLIPMSGELRNDMAERLLKYIEFHTESAVNVNSLKVLHELFR